MRILNVSKGEAYQLKPDTKLTIERTNPFFNDYAEQTIPCSLPASPHNLRLLDLESAQGYRQKQMLHDVTITDGEYFAQCRQAVLSVKRRDNVSTSFYMNDGSLYARIGETALKDIWTGDHERLTYGNGTLDDMISLCRLMASGSTLDSHATYGNYRIFPVLLTNDSGLATGFNYKVLNNWGSKMTVRGGTEEHMTLYKGSAQDFMNAVETKETVSGTEVNVPKGYYISPFIRVEYVLRRIFGFFGYTLDTDFFDNEPFRSMVVVNNVIDTIIYGYALNRDLVPDITCREFLAVIRKKFCCEFTSDERTRTVGIAFMKDMADAAPVADLTDMLTEQPTYQFMAQKQYRRVVLKPKYDIDDDAGVQTYDTLESMLHDHSAANYNPITGIFQETGYKPDTTTLQEFIVRGYNAGGEEEEDEIEIGDCQPLLRRLVWNTEDDGSTNGIVMPYIGAYTTLHSKLTAADGSVADTAGATLQPMLAFMLHSPLGAAGTTSSYTWYDTFPTDNVATRHLWDYSLFYWGEDGLFERFYRQTDRLYRNALEEMKVRLLLSQHQKADMPVCAVYTLQGQRCMIDKLKFTIGNRPDIQESTLLTLTEKQPVSEAGTLDALLPIRQNTGYRWEVRTETNMPEYMVRLIMPNLTFIFPPAPTAEYVGVKYGLQVLENYLVLVGDVYYKFWLESVPVL